jgi:hypothetical protein
MRRTIIGISVALCVARPSFGHDIYTQLRSPNGQLCCGGDPVTGDCEAVKEQDYKVLLNGDVIIHSKRHNAMIRVGSDKITWLPVPGQDEPAAWCGVPRYKVYLAPFNDANPDKAFWTYCMFIAPGGV